MIVSRGIILNRDFYIGKRDELLNKLPGNVAAFVFAGKSKAMSQDTDYRFLPDRNFYYLTGSSIEGAVLVIKDSRSYLFAPVRNAYEERWTGKRLDFEKIIEETGVDEVKDINEFDPFAYEILKDAHDLIALDGASIMDEPRAFREEASVLRSPETFIDMKEILIRMRMVKNEQEIAAIIRACDITNYAISDMRRLIRTGVTELELYTELEFAMAKRGSLIPAFSTIVAIGNNAFYLHHSEPENSGDGVATNGDAIQIDVGARSEGYCADVSRVFFVGSGDGNVTEEHRLMLQKLIVELRKCAFGFIKPGVTIKELNAAVRAACALSLEKFGLISHEHTEEEVSRYYWHNTAHHLGLDVHDASFREEPFVPGNCLAVEPGVYIPEWNIGFRIEDDVVVTDEGCRFLSRPADDLEDIICR